MFYVVDNAQTDHFVALKSLLHLMGYSWSQSAIEHVKFGRIKGMSTRKGTVVLLSDILDEANRRMKSKQLESPTTKVDVETNPQVTGTLAVSALVIHDLKQRRQRDYTFQWDDALQVISFIFSLDYLNSFITIKKTKLFNRIKETLESDYNTHIRGCVVWRRSVGLNCAILVSLILYLVKFATLI